jgi:MerR family mercuric resistance operon transcriptional regulator
MQILEKTLSIGLLSTQTNCKIETIRYYEKIGIFPKPPRTEGGHRIYSENHLKRLVFIRRGRELGFSLEDIRALLKLIDGGGHTCQQVEAITLHHLGNIHQKILDLKKLEKILAKISSQCGGKCYPNVLFWMHYLSGKKLKLIDSSIPIGHLENKLRKANSFYSKSPFQSLQFHECI